MRYLKSISQREIGLLLLLFYFIQLFIPWHDLALVQWQNQRMVKIITGCTLLFVVMSPWLLTFSRVVLEIGGSQWQTLTQWHRWIGTISPIVYFFHSIEPGYGLLLLLTSIFFINHFLASLNNEAPYWIRIFPVWILIHVSLSILIMVLSCYHIYLIAAY